MSVTGEDRISPPVFAARLIGRSLPDEIRDAVLEDMDELYRRRMKKSGVLRAQLWYCVQALSFTSRFLWERMRPSSDAAQLYERERVVMTTGISWIDVKLGARMLRKYPSVSIIGGLALAAAIALGATAFEYMRSQLHPDIPLPDGDRLVQVESWNSAELGVEQRVMYDLSVWRAQLESIEDLSAVRTFERNLIAADGATAPVRVAEVTASTFPLTGVQPLVGRALLASDEAAGAQPVAVLGYELWRDRFGGDRSVIGRSIRLGRADATVVGVMPDGYAFPHSQQAWVPLSMTARAPLEGAGIKVFGRLAKGASLEKAQVELDAVSRQIAAMSPATHAQISADVRLFGTSRRTSARPIIMLVLYIGTFMFLLAACANVATLVFARTAMRESEIVVRSALGATRRRVMSQLFAESLVLAGVSAVVGLGFVTAALRYRWHQTAVVQQVPQAFWADASLEPETILYSVLLAVAGAVLIGLLPAIRATGAQVQSALQNMRGGPSMRFGGVWSVIIVLQVAFTVLCLPVSIGASSEMRNDHTKRAEFPSKQVLTVRPELDRETGNSAATELTDAEYRTRMQTVYDEFRRRVLAEPGVTSVTFADALPGMSHPMVELEAQRGSGPVFMVNANRDGNAHISRVDVNFFEAFSIPIVSGRSFQPGDAGSPAAPVVINESLARNIGGNPLGVRLRTAAEGGSEAGSWHTVVGVHRNLQMDPTDRGETDMILVPSTLADAFPATMAIHMNRTLAGFAPRLNQIATKIDPGLRLYDPASLSELIRRRDLPGILASFAAIGTAAMAVILSAAGLYALVSVSVSRRTREVGIRLALGASTFSVMRSIFARSAAQVGTGILVGNVLAVTLVSVLSSQLKLDVLVPMLGVSLLMLLVGTIACTIPARRVLRVQPTDAFREV
ncbi:MAG TPA: ABC transporter permease [Longimicrobiales bacterium]